MRPVIFLDVDGVLNVSQRQRDSIALRVRRDGRAYRMPANWRTVWRIVPDAVAALDELARDCGADLCYRVSAWRLQAGARERLAAIGVTGRWHRDWRTDDGPGGRGEQVSRWLSAHDQPAHLVIDDRPAELQAHAGRLILTAHHVGLTVADARRGAALLRGPPPPPLKEATMNTTDYANTPAPAADASRPDVLTIELRKPIEAMRPTPCPVSPGAP